ncbi:hypothetical protein ABH905_005246 [Pseudomonas frederiksbergensis]|uniref:hypothetical protein n=1 Tax=Pseudomonas frederiksbergensis TaxID=104087 RepID=UPI003D1E5D0C
MTYLKNLSAPLWRYTPHNPSDPHTSHEQQRDFEAFLNPPPPKNMFQTPLPLDDAGQQNLRPALAQAFAPDITRLRSLGRTCPGPLDLRLTNGPLAGLEIRASAQADLLRLSIKVPERSTFERIVGTRATLEVELVAIFNRPVALELQYINGEPW